MREIVLFSIWATNGKPALRAAIVVGRAATVDAESLWRWLTNPAFTTLTFPVGSFCRYLLTV
jgi:hypothetical protein